MTTERFQVPDVSCQHCVKSITGEVSSLPGVQQVQVALDSKIVTVEHSGQSDTAAIVAAIKEAGFESITPLA